ncbi:MAG: 1-acyl-sn-glycerol-3-phosphate acyltransferase [Selenomonadaceae bacterium]|nr:1-acyl-sn-glycerol-3-phosphate acyltransferase [Selenomonadaceae bacterium]
MFYKFFKILCRIWYGIFLRTKVIGAENIPAEGGFILASNHMANWDPPFLGTFSPRIVNFMGKEELFKNPIMAAICRGLHVFPVKRGAADKAAIKTAVKILKSGECLGIFPEGTRSKTGKLGKAEPGVSLIAAMTKMPIIPAAIVNTDKIFSAEVKFPRLAVVYGTPIYFDGNAKDKEQLANFAQSIMAEIAKLKTLGENSL